jgi:hypothetical protein
MNFIALRICTGVLMLSIGGWFALPVIAQNYPSGPIRIIVPYAAGGSRRCLGAHDRGERCRRGGPASHC